MDPKTSRLITLSCPSCGGKLQITNEMDRFACAHCGNEHVVQRSGGAISLKPVVEGLKNVQKGVDKTASELAIVRLKAEIDELEDECDELEDDLNKNKVGWTVALYIFAIGIIFALIFRNLLWSVIISILASGALVGRLRIRDDGQIAKKEELLDSCEKELEYHKNIVRHV